MLLPGRVVTFPDHRIIYVIYGLRPPNFPDIARFDISREEMIRGQDRDDPVPDEGVMANTEK